MRSTVFFLSLSQITDLYNKKTKQSNYIVMTRAIKKTHVRQLVIVMSSLMSHRLCSMTGRALAVC